MRRWGSQCFCQGLGEELLVWVQAGFVFAMDFPVRGQGAFDYPLELGLELLMGRRWQWLKAQGMSLLGGDKEAIGDHQVLVWIEID